MPGDLEQSILIRRFRGVDLSQDPAFIGQDVLALSDSFAPNPVFVLAKRQGQTLLRQISADLVIFLTASPVLVRTYDDSGNRYFVAVVRSTAGGSLDTVVVSVNDALFATPANAGFPTNAALYGAAQLGQVVYVGNGIDPLKAVNLSATPTCTDDPFAIGSFTNGAADPTVTSDVNSELFTGTYSYAWVVYNSVAKKWTQRSDTKTFTLKVAADQSLSFPIATGYTLLTNEKFHLFVAPANRPIELATDQTPEGVTTGATVVRRVSVDGTALPIRGNARTGNLLLAHRDRLWVSGDQTTGNASRVYATSIILPGTEQPIFDIQPYFPTNATLNVGRQDGDRVTALARASMTVTTQSPDSPLLIFKNSALWAFFGDILDDPNSDLLQLSAEIGCPAPFSIVETPIGTIFLGLESIYLVRPDQLIPVDVGYPLFPVIRQILATRRAFACAVYHRGFYKLAFTPPGGTSNTVQWWLDLRRGLGSTPSWWGPHTTTPLVAFANGRQDTVEVDRAYQLQSKGTIAAIDQLGVARDLVDDSFGTNTMPIRAKLRLATLDEGAPFDRKRFTRLRSIVRVDSTTSIGVAASTDGHAAVMAETLSIPAAGGQIWDKTWDTPWTAGEFSEIEAILTDSPFRQPARTLSVELNHNEAVGVQVHDVEVDYVPVPRRVM